MNAHDRWELREGLDGRKETVCHTSVAKKLQGMWLTTMMSATEVE